MNIEDEARKEAVEWVSSAISKVERFELRNDDLLGDRCILVSVLRTLRSALEPTVITWEWVQKLWYRLLGECVDKPDYADEDKAMDIIGEALKELGITVEEAT